MKALPTLIDVKTKEGFQLWLQYDDGVSGTVNLSNLRGKGVFIFWNDEKNFERVFINKTSGAVAWNDEIDLCPNSLYLQLTNKTFSDYASH